MLSFMTPSANTSVRLRSQTVTYRSFPNRPHGRQSSGLLQFYTLCAAEETDKKKPEKQKSGFQKRLEEMAKQKGYNPPKKK